MKFVITCIIRCDTQNYAPYLHTCYDRSFDKQISFSKDVGMKRKEISTYRPLKNNIFTALLLVDVHTFNVSLLILFYCRNKYNILIRDVCFYVDYHIRP